MTTHHRRRARAVIGLCLAAATMPACSIGDGSAATTTSVPSSSVEEVPFPISRGAAAGDGDDLVVIESRGVGDGDDPLRAVLRRDDGTWVDLPDLPFSGFLQLATADGRAVVGGIACTDGSCEGGEVAFAMLDPHRQRWIRLDAPHDTLPVDETELTSSAGRGELAQFAVGATGYLVSSDGHVQRAPGYDADGRTRTGCTVDDTEVTVDHSLVPPPEGVAALPALVLGQDVRLRPIDRKPPGTRVDPPPEGVGPAWQVLCVAGRFTILDDATEAVLDVDARTWTLGPSNLAAAGGSGCCLLYAGRVASAPDGETAFVLTSQGLLSRVGDGDWGPVDTGGRRVDQVFSTGSAVLAVENDGMERSFVTEIWRR